MEIDPDKVPRTMEEAVAMVISGLSEADKTAIKDRRAQPEMLYFGTDMALRNDWSFWEDTPLRRDCIAKWKIAMADDLSGLLFAWVFAEVRGEPFDPEQHCQIYHEHWKQYNTTSLKAANIHE